jgi:hypothetical protein
MALAFPSPLPGARELPVARHPSAYARGYRGGGIASHDGMVTFSPSGLAGRGNSPWLPSVAGRIGTAPGASYPGSCGQAERTAIAPRLAGKMQPVDHQQWVSPGYWGTVARACRSRSALGALLFRHHRSGASLLGSGVWFCDALQPHLVRGAARPPWFPLTPCPHAHGRSGALRPEASAMMV